MDVSELFLRQIKWTANPDGSLCMPTPPTKQRNPGHFDVFYVGHVIFLTEAIEKAHTKIG